jgi:hypothetical protein
MATPPVWYRPVCRFVAGLALWFPSPRVLVSTLLRELRDVSGKKTSAISLTTTLSGDDGKIAGQY